MAVQCCAAAAAAAAAADKFCCPAAMTANPEEQTPEGAVLGHQGHGLGPLAAADGSALAASTRGPVCWAAKSCDIPIGSALSMAMSSQTMDHKPRRRMIRLQAQWNNCCRNCGHTGHRSVWVDVPCTPGTPHVSAARNPVSLQRQLNVQPIGANLMGQQCLMEPCQQTETAEPKQT